MRTKNTMKRIIASLLMPTILTSLGACAGTGSAGRNKEYDYVIKRTDNSSGWESIPVAEIDKVLWTDGTDIRAFGQLCYDDDNLYVHLRAVEKDIRAENTEPLSPVYEDSCLELFFMLPDGNGYFNFEMNLNGCLCLQFGPDKADRINIVRDDSKDYFNINTGLTDDGWEVFYRIPLRFIRLFCPDYSFGGELMVGMYKCGNKTVKKHYISWMDIDLEKPNFHCPEFFGKAEFE